MDLEPYLSWARVERGLSEATLRSYEHELRRADAELPGLDQATTGDLRRWLHANAGAAPTIGRRIAALRSYFRWSARTSGRSDDPSSQLDRPRVRAGLPRPVEDLEHALGALDSVSQAIAIVLVETGARISEGCSIRVGVPAPEELVVHGKGGKDRLIPLSPEARAALDELGGSFGLSARTIQRRFARVGFSPHRLRHTLATELAASGADLGEIQELLGHASPATTRIYAAYRTDRLRRALDRRRGEG